MTRTMTQTVDTRPDGIRVVRIETDHPYELVFIPKRPQQTGWVWTEDGVESRLFGRWLVPQFHQSFETPEDKMLYRLGYDARDTDGASPIIFIVQSAGRLAYAALSMPKQLGHDDKLLDMLGPGYFYEVKFA